MACLMLDMGYRISVYSGNVMDIMDMFQGHVGRLYRSVTFGPYKSRIIKKA